MADTIKLKPKILFLYPGQSRKNRINGLESGSVPQDFFYGLPGAMQAGYDCVIGDTRSNPKGLIANYQLKWEIFRNRITRFGFSKQRVKALYKQFENVDIAISFTDFFSLSMALWAPLEPNRPLLVGGFHGLTDQINKAHPLWQKKYECMVKRSLKKLDHIFFFGEADMREAINRYDLDRAKTSLFSFGVDTKFWTSSESSPLNEEYVLAVGSDPQRDYETLINVTTNVQIKILTKLKIKVPPERHNIELLSGSFYNSEITDEQLRKMYQAALAIIIPLKDVNQPSGYSVALQAMACGKPIILTKTSGLWDSHLFKSGENCLLVDPFKPKQIAEAIEVLKKNKNLCARLGMAAQNTARKEFGIDRMNNAINIMLAKILLYRENQKIKK